MAGTQCDAARSPGSETSLFCFSRVADYKVSHDPRWDLQSAPALLDRPAPGSAVFSMFVHAADAGLASYAVDGCVRAFNHFKTSPRK